MLATIVANTPKPKRNWQKVTFVNDMADIGTDLGVMIHEDEENNFRQCSRYIDIYSLKHLQKKRRSEEEDEDYLDYKTRNWTPTNADEG